MRFDLHCHTREGSLDAKVSLKEYVMRLKAAGFDGMLLTDHDSYKAYRYYLKNKSDPVFLNFTILKGIEYDTCDAGHILVIMPEHVRLPILELRGLPVKLLIELVHFLGGILGPAHPFGQKYFSIATSDFFQKNSGIVKQFDFMEIFNACESEESNAKAAALAEQYHLTGTAGSDTHKPECAGHAYTDFTIPVKSENDLIKAIRLNAIASCGGSCFEKNNQEVFGRFYKLVLLGYLIYSKISNFFRSFKRKPEMKEYMQLIESRR